MSISKQPVLDVEHGRRFLDINPERGSKAKKGKVTSKKTGHVVHKKNSTINTHVSSLLRKLADFEWDSV
ncbi:hypothetical protein DNTS_012051 [Danionella cerebrum]|uniref:Uncharacterized protein n=1 Tax=Danionella cerebrum TaxID=2873325 RepID=A0A553MX71_9TELE|nr:hypothetical protein DNTS_012051 [Danionella translucida]